MLYLVKTHSNDENPLYLKAACPVCWMCLNSWLRLGYAMPHTLHVSSSPSLTRLDDLPPPPCLAVPRPPALAAAFMAAAAMKKKKKGPMDLFKPKGKECEGHEATGGGGGGRIGPGGRAASTRATCATRPPRPSCSSPS